MRQTLNRSMIVMAAASGLLAAAGGSAYADASAEGAAIGSPGVGSGNAVQVPVHVPVNACGNTVNVIALLNPAFGNACANVSSSGHDDGYGYGDGGSRTSGSSAEGLTADSPGVLSGNLVQAPVHIPVNVCGNTADVIGALNPAFGNKCANESGPNHDYPPTEPPAEEPPNEEPPVDEPPTEEPPTEQPPVDEPPAEEPPTEQPPTEEPPTQEPPVDEPPAEEPPADTPGTDTPGTDAPGSETPALADTGAAGLGLAAGASAALLLGGTVLMRRTRNARD